MPESSGVPQYSCSGRWRIVTASGTWYVLDTDWMTLTRVVDDRLRATPTLRGDGMPVPVMAVERLAVGERAAFILAGLAEDDITTRRETSEVLVLERLDGAD